MDGKFLKEILDELDVNYAQMAAALGLNSRQSLNSKFKSDDITVSFLLQIAEYVKKDVYFFLNRYNKNHNKTFNTSANDDPAPYSKNLEATNKALQSAIDSLQQSNSYLLQRIKQLENESVGSKTRAATANTS